MHLKYFRRDAIQEVAVANVRASAVLFGSKSTAWLSPAVDGDDEGRDVVGRDPDQN